MRLSVNSYRKAFVYPVAVDIECRYGHTSEMLELGQDVRLPFSQAILYESKF